MSWASVVAASFLCSIHHAASFILSTCLRSSANASRSSMRAWRASTSTWLRVRRRIGSARSHWDFEPLPDGGCDVDFSVDFEFRNAILQAVIGVVFDEAMRRVVRAFEARAEALYG